jgi:hypothetical protein
MGKSTAKSKMTEEAAKAGSATLPAQQGNAASTSADPQTLELEQQIRELAYHLYEQRAGQNGSAEQDWLQAEAMVLSTKEELAA